MPSIAKLALVHYSYHAAILLQLIVVTVGLCLEFHGLGLEVCGLGPSLEILVLFTSLETDCCQLADNTMFHAHTTHSATGALLLPGHVSGAASQHTCTTKTLLTTVSGVNLRRRIRHIGFNVASGAQCDILLNCAIEIFLLN